MLKLTCVRKITTDYFMVRVFLLHYCCLWGAGCLLRYVGGELLCDSLPPSKTLN